MFIKIISLLSLLSLFLSTAPGFPAVFNISSGDVGGLIAAINTANSNGEENTINLAAGTYTLTAIDNDTDGPNGLPSVTSILTIIGAGAEITIIERDSLAAEFRIVQVSALGGLTLERLAIMKGIGPFRGDGGGIFNRGSLTISNSLIAENRTNSSRGSTGGVFNTGILTVSNSTITRNSASSPDSPTGGGLSNSNEGKLTVTHSTIKENFGGLAGGGLINRGTAAITKSTISNNRAVDAGGGIHNDSGSIMTVTNTTIANNAASDGGGIFSFGPLGILNSTISLNVGSRTGGLSTFGVSPELQNSIVALNSAGTFGTDCHGPVTSLGNNIIGDPTGCTIALQPSDLTGDAGLAPFIDSGAPGTGRFPLLGTSQAIDKGNSGVCLANFATDQLGQPRSVDGIPPRFEPQVFFTQICDIGAVEFFPIVNDLLQLRESELVTNFDPTPAPGAPAGTFVITATFVPRSGTFRFDFPFFEVTAIALEREGAAAEDQPTLLNADRGPGRVGARGSPPVTTLPFGGALQQQFRIGLQTPEPFVFFVNVLAEVVTRFPF